MKPVSCTINPFSTDFFRLKYRLDQAIKLPGSADFDSIKAYQGFIDRSIARLNRYTLSCFQEEQKVLKPLPKERFMDFTELTVKVTISSTIAIKRGLYTVPSRLVGETLLKQAQNQTQPDLKTLQSRYLKTKEQPAIGSKQHEITDYDALLSGQWIGPQQPQENHHVT